MMGNNSNITKTKKTKTCVFCKYFKSPLKSIQEIRQLVCYNCTKEIEEKSSNKNVVVWLKSLLISLKDIKFGVLEWVM